MAGFGRISVLFPVCAERRNNLQMSANSIRNGLMEVEGKLGGRGLTDPRSAACQKQFR